MLQNGMLLEAKSVLEAKAIQSNFNHKKRGFCVESIRDHSYPLVSLLNTKECFRKEETGFSVTAIGIASRAV